MLVFIAISLLLISIDALTPEINSLARNILKQVAENCEDKNYYSSTKISDSYLNCTLIANGLVQDKGFVVEAAERMMKEKLHLGDYFAAKFATDCYMGYKNTGSENIMTCLINKVVYFMFFQSAKEDKIIEMNCSAMHGHEGVIDWKPENLTRASNNMMCAAKCYLLAVNDTCNGVFQAGGFIEFYKVALDANSSIGLCEKVDNNTPCQLAFDIGICLQNFLENLFTSRPELAEAVRILANLNPSTFMK